jgi:hypothetical protein
VLGPERKGNIPQSSLFIVVGKETLLRAQMSREERAEGGFGVIEVLKDHSNSHSLGKA